MMAKLTPPRGKFGHPSGQVWSNIFPGQFLYSQTYLRTNIYILSVVALDESNISSYLHFSCKTLKCHVI